MHKRGQFPIDGDTAAAGRGERALLALDTPFDQLTLLAKGIFDCPLGLVSVLDGDLAVFRSDGQDMDRSLAKGVSVSQVLVDMGPGAVLIVEDALANERFRGHPWVTGQPQVRFFVGTTICLADGSPIGALGVMDCRPRPRPSDGELAQLKRLAKIAGNMVDQSAAARVQAEQLELLRLTERVAGVAHWRWDVDADVLTWSDEVYRIRGVERGAFPLTLDTIMAAYHPEDQAVLRGLVANALATGAGYECQLRLTRPDGEERITRGTSMCETDADGRVHALFGVFQDVTDEVTAFQRVQGSEARYRLLADHSTDIIGTADLDGVFSYLSPAIETVLGYRPEDLIGRTLAEFVHADDLDATRRAYLAYVKADPAMPPPRITFRAWRKTGEMIWLEAHPKLIRDADGRPVQFQDRARDVTHTKALEAELIEARDRAEAGGQAKSDFLSNMSHELRTPLTSVIGFANLLRESKTLGAQERRYADRISVGSDALLSVINDVLDYSKLEAGGVELDPHPFDPRELVAGVTDLIEGQATARGLTVHTTVREAVPLALMGDSGRLRQVLLNLMYNAVKFTATGGVTLVVDAAPDAAGRFQVSATIEDTGIGISNDTAASLFERFVQADVSTTRAHGGTGLGLAISRQLIDLMGGEIGARGVTGVGSTFWFRVPLEAVAACERRALTKTAALRQARILVADDASANRELISTILVGFGLDVTSVENGAEAVAAASQGGYDLILMDVQMPVMDGLDATRAIRRVTGDASRTPILALTANVEPGQVERCLAAGMDGHLAKPIAIDRLAAALAAWLSSPDAGDAGSTATSPARRRTDRVSPR